MATDLDLTDVFTETATNGRAVAKTEEPPAKKPARSRAAKKTPTVIFGGKYPLYFDLETVPDEERLHQFGLDPLPELRDKRPHAHCPSVEAVRGYSIDDLKKTLRDVNPCDQWLSDLEAAERADKKPRKGAFDAINELRQEAENVAAACLARQTLLSVTPEYNRIVAAGWSNGDGEPRSMVVGEPLWCDESTATTEVDILDRLWALINTAGPLVGFNVLAFDLPTLFVRSALLGVKPLRRLDLRPWGADVIDLMKARFPGSTPKGFGLKSLAKCYGITPPAGETDGGDVLPLFRAGKLDEIGAYVRSDVEVSVQLHAKFRGYFCG